MPRTLPDGTRVYSRREVGYRYGRGRKGTRRRRHFIKHTAVSPTGNLSVDAEMALCRAFERYHVGTRRMAGIAYSWLVGHSGTIYEGRGWGHDGSHTQNGGNRLGYASCTIGDHTTDVPTAAAWRADRALIADGIAAGTIDPNYEVSGHGGWYPKECPGRHIRDRMHTELAPDRVTPTPATEEDDVIKRGDTGNHVTNLQWDLNELLNGRADHPKGITEWGTFGAHTEAAVRNLQARYGYTQTGIYDLALSIRVQRELSDRRYASR